MEKFLFIMEGFYPETSPNGVCIKAVTKELINDGHEVHVLNPGKFRDTVVDGVYVHFIPESLFIIMRRFGEHHPKEIGNLIYKAAMLLNKVQKVIMLPWYPLNHPMTLYRYYSRAVELCKKYHFTRIVGVYLPLEATLAALNVKKAYEYIPTAIYVSDSLIYISGTQYFPPKVAELLKWRLEKKIYEESDRVFNIRCHEVHHSDSKYEKYRKKMEFLDTPLFEPASLPTEYEQLFDKKRIQWSYMGTMFDGYREPYYMAKMVEALESEIDIQVHFYRVNHFFYVIPYPGNMLKTVE